MLLSSILKKQLTAFLNGISNYTRVAMCLTDGMRLPVLNTDRFQRELLGTLPVSAGRELHPDPGKMDAVLWLYAVKEEGCAEAIRADALLDLAADGIERLFKSEAEIQSLSEELLERYQELHVLYDVIEDVSMVFDEREICKTILKKAVHALNVEFGAVVLMNGAEMSIRCSETDPKSTLAVDEHTCVEHAREVVASGKHLIIEQTEQSRQSVLAVPISIGNQAMGAIVLQAGPERGMFTSGDRISLGALAGYLGVAVNSARLLAEAREAEALRHEIAFAQQIQQSLLPEHVPVFQRLDVAARCLPSAQVGGDLFGFHRLDASHWMIIVADVAGHGLGAAFIMASLRSTLRSEAKPGHGPAQMLQNSNNLLDDDTHGNDVYATVFAAVYSERDNVLQYSNAGHPPALLWRASSKAFCELAEGGIALGLFRDETYEENVVSFQSGDILVMYTDGITETRSPGGELYESHRLREAIAANASASSEGLMKAILSSVERFQGGARQRDDVTLLIFKSH